MGSTFNLTAGSSNSAKIVLDGFCTSTYSPPAHRAGTSLSERFIWGGAATVGGIAIFAGTKQPVDGTVSAFSNYYDETGTRTIGTSLSNARGSMGAASVGDVAVFAGGYTGSGSSSTVDFYDSTGTRTTGAPVNSSRYALPAAAVDNLAVFAGGYTGSGSSSTVDF